MIIQWWFFILCMRSVYPLSQSINLANITKEITITAVHGEELKLSILMPLHSQRLLVYKLRRPIVIFTKSQLKFLDKKSFENGLTTFSESESNVIKYGLWAPKLSLNDQQRLTIVAVNNTMPDDWVTNITLNIKVYGGPFVCNKERKIVIRTNPLRVKDIICSNPKPMVTWYVDNNLISGGDVLKKQLTKYSVRKIFTTQDVSLCGKRISYVATGRNGISLNRSTLLVFPFKPDQVQILSSVVKGRCVKTNWKLLNTGKCNVTYYIEYKVNSENKAIHHASVEGENSYEYCMENILDVKHTGTVYMRAAFGDIKGLWNNLRMSYETPLNIGQQSNILRPTPVSIAVAVVVMLILFLIMCLVSYCILRKKGYQARRMTNVPELVIKEDKNIFQAEDLKSSGGEKQKMLQVMESFQMRRKHKI